MYFPYFRGKQFELIVIRDMAQLLAENSITPIIEPVRENLSGLKRALEAVVKNSGKAIVIINPQYGDFQSDASKLVDLLRNEYSSNECIAAGIILTSAM